MSSYDAPQDPYGQDRDRYGQHPNPYGGGPYEQQPRYGGTLPSYAGWGKRAGGFVIDGLLLVPFYIVAAVLFGMSSETTSSSFTDPTGQTTQVGQQVSFNGPLLIVAGLLYLAAIAFAIWNQVIRQGRTGRSIGKGVVGIKLVSESTGQPLGAGLTFVRQLAHFLDSIACYVGWLWPLWDDKRQTFADKVMSSLVVEAPKG